MESMEFNKIVEEAFAECRELMRKEHVAHLEMLKEFHERMHEELSAYLEILRAIAQSQPDALEQNVMQKVIVN